MEAVSERDKDWPEAGSSWLSDVVTRSSDGRPMFWNENIAQDGCCMRCGLHRPVVSVVFHEQSRKLCRECTYGVANDPAKWPK